MGARVSGLVIRNAHLRWPIDTALQKQLPGQTLTHIERRGKYLLLHLSRTTLIVHLGMSGSLRVLTAPIAPRTHDHYDLIFANGNILRYHDPRRFGCLLASTDAQQHDLLRDLGPEPLSKDFDGHYLWQASRNRRVPVKNFIMDSHVVVGVGNIYAAESLFAARIHPKRAAGRVALARYEALAESIQSILSHAIKQGGTTLRDFVNSDGEPGYFAQQLQVYGRAGLPCRRCHKILLEDRLGNRSSVYCGHCQR